MRTLTIPDFCSTVRNLYANDLKTELLCIAVCEIVPAISLATGLDEHEVIELLGSRAVDSVSEINHSIQSADNQQVFKRIGAARLGAVIRKCITSIAQMAELDPDELAVILTCKRAGSTEDIVEWLRAGHWIGGVAEHV